MNVTRFSITPVKGLGLNHPEEIELERHGVTANRRFFIVDEDGRIYAGLRHGALVQIRAAFDASAERLALTFPDGPVVEAAVELGASITTDFYGRDVAGHEVVGPWSEALSAFAGRPLRLLRSDLPGEGSDVYVGTLVSRASVEELGRRAGVDGSLDPRRFRMLIEIDGCGPHEEDSWMERLVRAGDAVLRMGKPVPRCAVTTQDPSTGVPDGVDTLRVLLEYREPGPKKTADFGVYALIEQPGRVRVGDPVELL